MYAAVALGLILLLGLVERWEQRRCLAVVPIRIHVNGTRGKSTVTRLIHGALCEAGLPAVGKTTGTAARLLMPDGSERPVPRRARPNIREQLWALRQARLAGARAAVLECMAVRPELQWVAEQEMVRATIGVITNVRPDHAEVMGRTLEQMAACLANTIPRRGLLVHGEPRFAEFFHKRAAEAGTAVRAVAAPLPGEDAVWLAEDMALALEVTRALGIADEVALAGMRRAVPDPGALHWVTLRGEVTALDASAANDPESLAGLLAEQREAAGRPALLVYNHRSDRPERLRTFLSAPLPGEVVVTGDPPGAALRLARRPAGQKVAYLSERRLWPVLRQKAAGPGAPLVVLCGNTKGWHYLREQEGEP
ncbi:MAG: poly-gamma-glutamate synthase PgsB [Chitinophagales bacterium]